MKRLLIILIIFLSGKTVLSQQQYFIYIESDNKQPFYVLLDGKTYSSSEAGYVILPKLGDSTQRLSIGFPKKLFPEQQFMIGVNKKDAGYQLKNLGDKGWALFNLQTLSLTMSNSPLAEKKSPDISGVKKTDDFSILLANVVNDSSILYTATAIQPPPAVKKESVVVAVIDKKPDVPASKPAIDSPQQKTTVITNPPTASKNSPTGTPVVKDPVVLPPPIIAAAPAPHKDTIVKTKEPVAETKTLPAVIKLNESISDSALTITFVVTKEVDTIIINIPFEKPVERVVTTAPQPVATTPDTAGRTSPVEKKEVNTGITSTTTAAAKPAGEKSTPASTSPPPINDCKNYATENDVDKLRIKILAVKTKEEKIDAAKKIFKTKCFSVRQIKALSELFKTDEERYLFFNASYKSVSDTYNFAELGNLITDDHYANSFKEMLR